jgi:hypothetical protein
MHGKLALAAGAAALLVATGSAWADGFTLKAPPKVAFLYFKAKNDGGWTQAFEEARPKMEKALGMQIPFVENIAEDAAQITPPAEKFIQLFRYVQGSRRQASGRSFPQCCGHDERPELAVVLRPNV